MKQVITLPGLLGAIWGFCGAFMLISYAVWRLAPLAVDTFNYPLNMLQWSALTANVVFMAYSEGYKGFQQAFAPRVAARSLYLSKNPSILRVLLAPLFVIGYFDATRHRMIISYLLTSMIIVLVVLTRMVDQPWRGIIDGGVVLALAWGTIAILVYFARGLAGKTLPVSAELPS